ncbi:MAG: peptidase [Synechococcales cyanobacterium RM1_1_8]|nr:peptidase [Synechococcales cyanobacterium RM1_1_8]
MAYLWNQRPRRRWFVVCMGICLGLLLGLNLALEPRLAPAPRWSIGAASLGRASGLARGAEPPAPHRTYPLPAGLEAVLEPSVGDYFAQIAPSPRGYLLWSDWPAQVYLQPPQAPEDSAQGRREAAWVDAAQGAIADWSVYVPLAIAAGPDTADIVILRQSPPLRWQAGQLSAARHAETRFQIVAGTGDPPCWHHRQTVYVGDRQGPQQLRGTLRHELGHALGLWGHSPNPGDVLYAGQVAAPPPISARDLNTLGRLYQQPTQLGCSIDYPETRHGS